jgi:hypothetical protein
MALVRPKDATAITSVAGGDIFLVDGVAGVRALAATSVAFTNAANTFTGTQTFGVLTATSINGNTITTGTGTLTIAAAKTLTVSNSLTLAGTDGTTQTFPATSGSVVTSSSVNAVTNAMRSQMAAKTLKGNATAATANESDIVVSALTDITTPSATLDWLIIENHTTGTLQKTNASELLGSATAGVSSINGLTGALTGILTNTRLAKTAAYTVANADNGSAIALGGSAFYPLTFPNPSGFSASWATMVVNEDAGRGKLLLPVCATSSTSLVIGTGSKAFTVASGLYFSAVDSQRFRAFSLANPANFVSGTGSYSGTTFTMTVDAVGGSGTITDWQIAPEDILWPRQTVMVFLENGVWRYDRELLWYPDVPQVQFNIDPTIGVDYTDGLATGTGNTLKHMQRAVDLTRARLKFGKDSGSQYGVAINCGGNTVQEFIKVNYTLERCPGFIVRNVTWKPANNGYCAQLADGAFLALGSGVTLDGTGVTSPIGYITGHGTGAIFDSTEAVLNVTTGGLSGSMFSCDSPMRWNFLNGLTVTNSGVGSNFQRMIYEGVPGSSWNINGPHTFVGTPVGGRFARCWGTGCDMKFQGNVTFSGAHSISISLINQNGSMLNFSGATLPGGTPTPTTGGQYNTSDAT